MKSDEEFFKFVEKFLERFGDELEDDGQGLVLDYIINHQISLLTGTKFLVNMPKVYSLLIVRASLESGFKVYVEQEAFETTLDFKILKDCVGVYTFDIYRNHIAFWDKFDELKRKEIEEVEKFFQIFDDKG